MVGPYSPTLPHDGFAGVAPTAVLWEHMFGYRRGMFFQPALLAVATTPERHHLSDGAWVDVARGWMGPDAGGLFERLVDGVPWRVERRRMYDRIVAVPRLVRFYEADEPWPDPVLRSTCDRLNVMYGRELDEPLLTLGLCLYRDGRDSVAWHGDTIGRGKHDDTMVAIVSLGSARKLTLRPRSGGPARSFVLSHGDLLVMGGSCQRTWEHAVPKTTRPVGPRVSVQLRPAGVR